jgi:hypothetical protein
MALLESVWQWLKGWGQYAAYCLDNGLTNHVCEPFYLNLVLGAIGAGVLVFIMYFRKWWRYRKGVRADWLRELDKDALADLETQRKYTWDGDRESTEVNQRETADRIRQALKDKAERERPDPQAPGKT